MRKPKKRFEEVPTLLLVQRQGLVARALTRFLKAYYGDIRVAASPAAAERMLAAEGRVLHDVVCGEDFGPDGPSGHDVIADWRTRFPQIRRAILATGAEGLPSCLEGIDGVYEKPAPLSFLLSLLGLTDSQESMSPPSNYPTQPPTYFMEQTMQTKSPQAHTVKTLKDRLSQAPKQTAQPGRLRSAQGFASI